MIKDEPKVFQQEVDLSVDHGTLSDGERCSLRAFLAYMFGEFLFPDRTKGRAHLSVVWAWKQVTIPCPLSNQLAPSFLTIHRWSYGVWETEDVFSRLYYSLFLDSQTAREVWAWKHITIPCPLPNRLAPSFLTIHRWSYGVWETEDVFSRLYYSLFLNSQTAREIDWTPMRVPAAYAASSRALKTTTHLICMLLVMPYFLGRVRHQFGFPQSFFEITLPWTPVNTVDEDAYMREMTLWIEEWRYKTARVISEEEEEGISLPLYEERYMVVLRDITTLTNHSESSGEEVSSLHAERDSVVEERDSIVEDLESLRRDFEGMREARAVAERDSMRDELERVQTELERARSVPSSSIVVPTLPRPSPVLIGHLERCLVRKDVALDLYQLERNLVRDQCHELLEDVKGLIDKSGKLSIPILAARGNHSLADVNPYVRVLLPSSAQSQS
ncbi:hypothetical protein AMTR_s00038p00129890 [Amborella trichopoda]|uniref:Aminotransferase-like plant mobile domain-containing protein n=1 Tax=Amborella trichopoda TaxID=13333 RepID=U5CWQ7_AMBTC|nr:hypothetical protein AMTR_s00038p00129890 [Amborella trichopoda]